MAISRKEELRALNAEERILVEQSHHPALQEMNDADLSNLVKLARQQRDKAQTEANRRRREMRGKADPKGSAVSARDDGSQLKVAVLAMTMRRLNTEVERRRRLAASITLVENARNVLALKQQAPTRGNEFNTRYAHQGMRAKPNTKVNSLIRPMERGRQRAAAQVAQAKRDAR
ncbi:hypothetical protein [Phyllobacterium zundukense]|jgi:hypothetical protein|uniref:Uncharacterized protein n=1 Tax=Phyllobacterium zundukense TaxID=1867719 RepID=A0ACD4D459_9HYPH|nr:hypothetical protein [Phyllobacterium zundukense]UXN60712.1 hypothetical protein N8E88_30260 [Phyllobacterium zundukense]